MTRELLNSLIRAIVTVLGILTTVMSVPLLSNLLDAFGLINANFEQIADSISYLIQIGLSIYGFFLENPVGNKGVRRLTVSTRRFHQRAA